MNISKADHTPEEEKLASWVSNYPNILKYWDFEITHFKVIKCDVDKLKEEIGSLHPDEQIMARFFVGVWLGANLLKFDVMAAIATLEDKDSVYIKSWVNDPFWL
jgi:hypothetical protein